MGSMSTEFRLLGPVEAVLGDQLASLGAPKQRALLAVMLLNANSVISRDGLIDALWGADPPRSAVQSLQVYVHGLRRAIGADRIETQGTGYELRLNPGELDVDRFEQLVERATRLPPPDAADDLRAALKLWNGEPLGDLGGERVAETSVRSASTSCARPRRACRWTSSLRPRPSSRRRRARPRARHARDRRGPAVPAAARTSPQA
jgi:Bacterial transcriptional activator domain